MNLVIVLLGIGAVILVHELGHFLAARFAGVRVETFSIGFGPRLFGWKRGGVDYRVSLIPLGGYVKMSGEEPGSGTGAEDDLASKSVAQRLLIFSAGVIMNFLFALVGFAVAFSVGVPFRPPVIGRVVPGGPAWEAGIPEGSRVLSVGNTRVLSFADISTSVALGGDKLIFTILPPGEKKPRKVEVHPFFDKTTGFNRVLVDPPMEDKVILHVEPGGPGERAGLKEGDELLLVNGKDARKLGPKALSALLVHPAPLKLTIARKSPSGEVRRMDVTVTPDLEKGPFRIGVQALTRKVRAIRRGDPLAARAGLRKGDVILQVQEEKVFTREDLTRLLSKARGKVKILVRRPVRGRKGKGGAESVLFRELPLFVEIPGPSQAGELLENLAFEPDGTYVLPRKGSPAARAGMLPGDRIVRIDGRPLKAWRDLVAAVSSSRDGKMDLVVERGGKTMEMTIQAEKAEIPNYGFQPVSAFRMENLKASSIPEAFVLGFTNSWGMFKQVYLTLKKILSGGVAAKNLGGPIMIVSTSASLIQQGLMKFLWFLAVVSVNLCFLNLLPIPILDGGLILFLLIEKIKGSPVSERFMVWAQVAGLALVLGLVLFVTYNDILRLIS